MPSVPPPRSFFDPDVGRRLAAANTAHPEAEHFALRELALGDDDARVRLAALERLKEGPDTRAVRLAATADEAPSVRQAAWLGLRASSPPLLERAQVALEVEPIWWVRRAIVACLARGPDTAEALLLALDDPQWRVRFAAARALRRLAAFELVRATLTTTPSHVVRQTCRFILGESSVDEPARPLPLDDDPAVAAEVLGASSASAKTLAGLLADPHERLREAAKKKLARLAPDMMAAAVLPWLDEPRLGEAHEAALELLQALAPQHALALALSIATAPEPTPGRGQLGWAFTQLVDGPDETHHPLLAALESGEPEVRGLAVLALLSSGDHRLIGAALPKAPTLSLVDRHAVERWFLSLEQNALAREVAQVLTSTTALRDEVTLHRGLVLGDVPLVACFVSSDSPLLAATAAAWLKEQSEWTSEVLEVARRSPDPWVRATVFTAEEAVAASTSREVIARRAAVDHLLRDARRLPATTRLEVANRLVDDPEGELRGAAVTLLQGVAPAEAVPTLLRLNLDPDLGVRSRSASALEAIPSLLHLLQSLVLPDERAQLAARQWLGRLSPAPLDLAQLEALPDASPRARDHLQAVRAAAGDQTVTAVPQVERPASPLTRPLPLDSWRPLGTTGLTVSPIVISGANALPVSGFFEAAEAGCNTFFWEPGDESSTRFLRLASPECQVLTGTYDSGKNAIRQDVERALKRLRRATLDVFLLFWVRSAGRVSEANFEALRALQREGKLRTFGFSTHLREVAQGALEAHAWPVVMTRYSLAHAGAEAQLFPAAKARGVGVFTFTSTCYGRLLEPVIDVRPPSAAECYRFGLDAPAVGAVVSAPRTRAELAEGLGVLSSRPLEPARQAELREHGRAVRETSMALNRLVRQVRSTGRVRAD
jgi:HEAT repeat protein